jgi:hypothetical protein
MHLKNMLGINQLQNKNTSHSLKIQLVTHKKINIKININK